MSKRLISLAGRQFSKRVRVDSQLGKMRNLVKAADGAMGDETSPGPHLPATCQLLDTPIKSRCDKKEYRVIKLENGLTALLVSDINRIQQSEEEEEEDDDSDGSDEDDMEEEESDMETEDEDEEEEGGKDCKQKPSDTTKYLAAASLTVGVGSFEDPEHIPGLMHFLEHMVFMGSEKFPKENDFDFFITKHGGHDNAHTDMEHTTFYFEVQERNLGGALDRFAQFFINPLMKQEAMEREREAVHSEFQMALPEDTYRVQQIFGTFALEGHPMGKFTWGNEATLNTGIPDEALHTKLHELRLKYYSGHYMTLAVQARLSLDALQELVCNIFSQVPNNKLARPSYTHLEFPFPTDKFHCLCRVVPTKEEHNVEVKWALPSLLSHYQTKPLHYISHLLGHEGQGSILSFLKKKVWASELYSGNDESGFEHNSTYAIMSISVDLTDEGFANLEEVLCVIFQYLTMLQEAGPIERVFREIQQIEKLKFEYAEEMSTVENVENLSEAMQLYPPAHYLTGEALQDHYDPKIIKECLDALLPETCNIIISSKTQEDLCQQTEKWFGTKYCTEEIPKAWKERWASLPSNPDLFIPTPNLFIPDNFDLQKPEKEVPEYPECLVEDERGTLWFRQDVKFQLPRTYCYVYFLSDVTIKSPRMAALQDLFLSLFEQQVMEDLYPANMAQYVYSFISGNQGLLLKVNGFNQKLPQVLDLLLHHIENFGKTLDEKTFQEMRQQHIKGYYSSVLKPDKVRNDLRLAVLQDVHWTCLQKLQETKTATIKDILEEFVPHIFSPSNVRVLVQGNNTREEAKELYGLVKKRLRPPPEQPLMELCTNELAKGSWAVRAKAVNPANTNTSIISYYQHKQGSLKLEVMHEFIDMVMEGPVFDQLRTKEQLGYHVHCTNHNTYGILGLSITVNTQANKFSASHVDQRIDAFVEEFVRTVKNMGAAEVAELKETLTSMKQTIDLTLKEEVNRNWSEIVHGEYLFDRLKKQVDLIQEFTHKEVVECLQELMNAKSPNYKKLSVQVVGASDPEAGAPPSLDALLDKDGIVDYLLPEEGEESCIPKEHFITDISAFKEKLKLFPPTKIM
ncbi:nardilysin-like [Scylla paramamosain]